MVVIVHFHTGSYYRKYNKDNNEADTIEDIDEDKLCKVILITKGIVNSTNTVLGISFSWFHCSKQKFFTTVFFSILYYTLTVILDLFIVSLDLKSKVIQILFFKAVVLWLAMNILQQCRPIKGHCSHAFTIEFIFIEVNKRFSPLYFLVFFMTHWYVYFSPVYFITLEILRNPNFVYEERVIQGVSRKSCWMDNSDHSSTSCCNCLKKEQIV